MVGIDRRAEHASAPPQLVSLWRAWWCWWRLCAVMHLRFGGSLVPLWCMWARCPACVNPLVPRLSVLLLVVLLLEFRGAVCCFPSDAPVCIGCFLLLPAALRLVCVPAFYAAGLRWCSFIWGFLLSLAGTHPFQPTSSPRTSRGNTPLCRSRTGPASHMMEYNSWQLH